MDAYCQVFFLEEQVIYRLFLLSVCVCVCARGAYRRVNHIRKAYTESIYTLHPLERAFAKAFGNFVYDRQLYAGF